MRGGHPKTKKPVSPEDEGPSSDQRTQQGRFRDTPARNAPTKKGLNFDNHAINDAATRLTKDEKYRALVLQRLGDWLEKGAEHEAVVALVEHLPAHIVAADGHQDPHPIARAQLVSMLDDAEKNLDVLEEEMLLSSFFEHALSDSATAREECIRERARLLEQMTVNELVPLGEPFGIKKQPHKVDTVQLIAGALTDCKSKPKFTRVLFEETGGKAVVSPVPNVEYLVRLFDADDRSAAEFARLSQLQSEAKG
jgi:hypothetical protein